METQSLMTPQERAHFLEHGYVLLKGAFSREWALNEVREQFKANGMDADKPETWREHRMSLPSTKYFSTREVAPRLYDAACEILGGEERMQSGHQFDNAVTACCFTGEGESWEAPDENCGWHKDGWFFRHFLNSPDQALLSLPLWSDVVPQGGGTFIAPQSVGVVARFLADHPEGVHPSKFPWRDLIKQCPQRMEAVGQAGDVYLMHGFMLHTTSRNPQRKLRCISNDIFSLKEPLQLNRADGNYSLVEQGVLRGLNKANYDFHPTRERLRTLDRSMLPMENQ